MDKIYKKILIIDGSFLLHRVLAVPNIFELKNTKGERTGGVFQFLRSLVREVQNNGNYFPIVCFDAGLAERRVKADENYKKYREHISTPVPVMTQDERDNDLMYQYKHQREIIIQMLSYMGVPALRYSKWEGDDLMYIISKMCEQCLVVTDDKDLLQLLSESCFVRRPKADEVWDLNRFLTEGLDCGKIDDIADFVSYKAIIGDASDNIPSSCAGIGKVLVGQLLPVINYCKSDNTWDFSKYPQTEDDMKKLCVTLNTKYRKAFLNFNSERFLTNLELVDLSKVEFVPEIVDSIKASISNSRSNVNYFKLVSMLAEYEIKDISPDSLIETIGNRFSNLFVEGHC